MSQTVPLARYLSILPYDSPFPIVFSWYYFHLYVSHLRFSEFLMG